MTYRFRYLPPGLAEDVHRSGREFLGRLDEGFVTLDAWRGRIRAAYEDVEAREAGEPEPADAAGTPEDAPPQYDVVRSRVERGDYSWDDVMSGAVTDPDARTVHVWLDSRVDLLQRAWREMERGVGADEAVDAAVREIERERTGRG